MAIHSLTPFVAWANVYIQHRGECCLTVAVLGMSNMRCYSLSFSVGILLLASSSARIVAQCPKEEVTEAAACQAETEAEQYVLRQVVAGNTANFPQNDFPDAKDRLLRACFIRGLLTNPGDKLTIHRHGVMVENAIVCGRIDLNNDEIRNDIAFDQCTFMNGFDATQSHFAKTLSLDRSTFKGVVDFELATVGFDLTMSECTFLSAGFDRVRVSGDWRMRKATFSTAVDFTGADVGGDLFADEAAFKGNADFSNIKVKGDARWRAVKFDAPAYFTSAHIVGNLVADDSATFARGADFNDIRVDGDANLRNITSYGGVNFSDGRFSNLFLDSSVFFGEANFTRTRMESGFLDKTDFRVQPTIDGMTFQYISPASWEELKKLASGPSYNAEFYSSLEGLFRRHGHPDQADEVFVAQQRRERETNPRILYKAWNWIQDVLVGYGRHMEKLLLWSTLFVAAGFLVFRREAGMKTKKAEDAELYAKRYRPFWYAVDLFLPFLSLGDAEIWTPNDDRRWANVYKRVHIILGHLLVPIGLAAWAGIIK